MVPSAWMSDVEPPLYCTDLFYPPYQSPLSHSPTDYRSAARRRKENTTSQTHAQLVDQRDTWAKVPINRKGNKMIRSRNDPRKEMTGPDEGKI